MRASDGGFVSRLTTITVRMESGRAMNSGSTVGQFGYCHGMLNLPSATKYPLILSDLLHTPRTCLGYDKHVIGHVFG